MSRYCGKCDFKDFLDMHDFDYIKRSNINIYDEDRNVVKITVSDEKDLIPYYAHLISSSAGDRNSSTVFLDSVPWLIRERERYGVLKSHNRYRKLLNESLMANKLPLKYEDEECSPLFFSKTNLLGFLFEEKDLLKYSREYLGILNDNMGNCFLCFSKNQSEGEYIISRIDNSLKNDLLLGKDSVNNIFKRSFELFIGNYNPLIDSIELVQRKTPSKIGAKHLPKKDLYYDNLKMILKK